MRKRLVNIIIVFLVFLVVLWLILDEYANFVVPEKALEYSTQKLSNEDTEISFKKEYPKEEVIKEYRGYNVIAKLDIPKIELETYILAHFSENALNVSPVKFWGSEPNIVRKYVRGRA